MKNFNINKEIKMNTNSNYNFICGKYKHYKGQEYYVYGLAKDDDNNKYILYQANYGNKKLWIRPFDMFFDMVSTESGKKDRFKKTSKGQINRVDALNALCNILDREFQYVFHSETKERYVIYSLKSIPNPIIFLSNAIKLNSSSYLTDFQIAYRMNIYIFNFDDKIHYCNINCATNTDKCFEIDNGDDPSNIIERHKTILEKQLNPCSVDLRITDNFFFRSKHTRIDLSSISNIKTAKKLWKRVKIYKKNNESYIKLKPKDSIITHTFEKIKIPSDCAGKIEIKSTYARLSLSVTTADFCNPGWEGFFPLVLRNDGYSTIYLHPKEKMLQIMLIPTISPIVTEYSKKSTYMNDDGTPFNYWNAKTIDYQNKLINDNNLKAFYNNMLSLYQDVETRERIENSFLKFCDRNKHKVTFKNHENKLDLQKIYDAYIKREKRLKIFSSVPSKLFSAFGFILSSIFSVLTWTIKEPIPWIKNNLLFIRLSLLICCILCLVSFLLIVILSPKTFCTKKEAISYH